jgi:hypothetical protein
MRKLTVAKLSGLLLGVLCCALNNQAQAFGPTDKARVLLVGDSIAYETGAVVGWLINSTGKATFHGATKGGMAICDWFPETRAPGGPGSYLDLESPPVPNLRELVTTVRPHAIVMQFWGNSWNFTPCMRGADGSIVAAGTPEYYERYKRDAQHAMEIIRDAARAAAIAMPEVFWVLQGPDRANPARTRTLNNNYLALASSWGSAFNAVDAGREVSMAAFYYEPGDRYGFAQFLPCTDIERGNGTCVDAYGGVAQIHKTGDDIHFCLGTVVRQGDWFGNCDTASPGLLRFGLSIAGTVSTTLGL